MHIIIVKPISQDTKRQRQKDDGDISFVLLHLKYPENVENSISIWSRGSEGVLSHNTCTHHTRTLQLKIVAIARQTSQTVAVATALQPHSNLFCFSTNFNSALPQIYNVNLEANRDRWCSQLKTSCWVTKNFKSSSNFLWSCIYKQTFNERILSRKLNV